LQNSKHLEDDQNIIINKQEIDLKETRYKITIKLTTARGLALCIGIKIFLIENNVYAIDFLEKTTDNEMTGYDQKVSYYLFNFRKSPR
jgi:hypothetical protein